MRSILPALLLLAPALHAAEAQAPAPRKKLAAISLLPNGSRLQGVMLPRYDDDRRLSGLLKSRTMTLINDETISGEFVSIEFFNPDRSPRGRVDLLRAVFDQVKGMLEAKEAVTLRSGRISAKGTGLIYAFEQGEGFLSGPATTRIQAPVETTMQTRPSPLGATAAIGISLLTPAAAAPPPAESTPAAAPASQAPAHAAASQAARTDLRAELDASASATAAARAFLEQADLASAASAPPPAEAKPLDVKPGPGDTLVSCDGGMYFDADGGVFVYLKNVRVADPRYALSGAAELKIFLEKKPAESPDKQSSAEKKPGIGLGAKFGDVERIVATGAVRILQKEVEGDKQPVEASGAIFTYHPKTGEIVLTGGYPWVKQGTTFMRANQPNLSLRIQKSGSFVTEGNWDMGGMIDQKR